MQNPKVFKANPPKFVQQGGVVVVTGEPGAEVLVSKNGGPPEPEKLDDEGKLTITTDKLEPNQKIVIGDMKTDQLEITVISSLK